MERDPRQGCCGCCGAGAGEIRTDGTFPGFVAKLGYVPSPDSPRRKTMRKIQIFMLTLVLGMACLGTVTLALAQDAKATSPNGASIEQTTIGQVQIEQYLMDHSEEIAMARTAAPESVSRDAE